MEVREEFVDRARGLHPLIEVIRIREEEALEPVGIARLHAFKKRIRELGVRRGSVEILPAAHAVFLESGEHLVKVVALGEHDERLELRIRAGLHLFHKSAVVQIRCERVRPGAELHLRVRETRIELEEPLVVDEAVVLQNAGDGVHVRHADGFRSGDVAVVVRHVHGLLRKGALRQRDLHALRALVEREHVRGRHPAEHREKHACAEDERSVHNAAHASDAPVAPGADGHIRTLRFARVQLGLDRLQRGFFLFRFRLRLLFRARRPDGTHRLFLRRLRALRRRGLRRLRRFRCGGLRRFRRGRDTGSLYRLLRRRRRGRHVSPDVVFLFGPDLFFVRHKCSPWSCNRPRRTGIEYRRRGGKPRRNCETMLPTGRSAVRGRGANMARGKGILHVLWK